MDYRNMTAPCGLDCFNCIMYAASHDEELRKKVGNIMNLPVMKAQCKGCRNEKGTIGFMGMSKPCSVFRCIEGRGFDFCCDCPDFPCDHLHPYADMASRVPHNTKVFNLCLIRKMGLEEWAAEKAREVRNTYFEGSFKL